MDTSFTNTENARTDAKNLINCAKSFSSCIDALNTIKKNLVNNWKGNDADILDIQDKVNTSVKYYNEKIIPAMTKLGAGIILLANAIDNEDNSNAKTNLEIIDKTPNWEYSTCNTGINYIFNNQKNANIPLTSITKDFIENPENTNLLNDVETVQNWFW